MSLTLTIHALSAGFPPVMALAGSAGNVARPLFGVGALMTVGMVFRPLLAGVVQAIRLLFSPRQTLEERKSRQAMRRMTMLNRMARDFDDLQPSQAAELRMLATRD